MFIYLHIGLLVAVAAATPVFAFVGSSGNPRPITAIFLAILPFAVIGVISSCLLNARGGPTIEWMLPTASVLLLSVCCRTSRVFRLAWSMLLTGTILLCGNVILLFGLSDYAREPHFGENVARVQERRMIDMGYEAISRRYSPDAVLCEGDVASILRDPLLDNVSVFVVQREWHTPLSGLYRVQTEKRVIWYPGGAVKLGVQGIELRRLRNAD
jgi:hypothetical protein